jgi:hypothetical protein
MIHKLRYIILLVCLTLVGCSNNPEQLKEHINGYWEITKVEKNGTLIKSYNINPTVDYFELSNDTNGFRKKGTPTFEGTFIVTNHNAAFTMKIENDSLNIYYTNNGATTKETIVKATKTKLIITNTEGFKYTYKPYETIDINNL